MDDLDLIMARRLQEQFDKESAAILVDDNNTISDSRTAKPSTSQTHVTQGLSVIDPVWETTDPNPDVHALFQQFNEQYFWGRLAGVEVKWSPRMTL
jgi:hypothetical protein